MQQNQGAFIVIEGVDSATRSTQFKLLRDRLQAEGYDVVDIVFPQYQQPSSFFVREYLSDNTTPDKVGPYTSSLFYTLDHYQAAPKIRQAIAEGKVVIANSYTSSLMAEQGAKFGASEDRYGYFNWLNNMAFQMLKNPVPSTSLVLQLPANQSNQTPANIYNNLHRIMPGMHTMIACTEDGAVLPSEAIQDRLWQAIEPLLPPKVNFSPVTPNHSQRNYYVPEQLDDDAKQHYCASMDQILDLQAKLQRDVSAHLEQIANTPLNKRDAAWYKLNQARTQQATQPVLPVATDSTDLIKKSETSEAITKLVQKHLPAHYSQEVPPLQLTSVWPTNEISLIADMLYQPSSSSLDEIRDQVANWDYNRKLKVYEVYLADWLAQSNNLGPVFNGARYSWDLVCSYSTLRDLQNSQILSGIEWQTLTPRYGYAVPQLVEDAGLVDEFEQCFELSLKLHSYLQQAGYIQEAQYATLFGHKLRCKFDYSAAQAFSLYRLSKNPGASLDLQQAIGQMHQKLGEVHPILADSMAKSLKNAVER